MKLRIFDVNQVNIQSVQYFFIHFDDDVIVNDLIHYIKNTLIPQAPKSILMKIILIKI